MMTIIAKSETILVLIHMIRSELRLSITEPAELIFHISVKENILLNPLRWSIKFKVFIGVSLAIVMSFLALSHGKPTAPSPSRVGFQHDCGTRGTMDIIFSCTSTMLVCVVTAVHFGLPANNSHRLSLKEKIKSRDYYKILAFKAFVYTSGLIVPECVAGRACFQYCIAYDDCAYMKRKSVEGWTIKHSLFASMDGFTLEDGGKLTSGRQLVKRGVILDKEICEKLDYEISDKSKADVLAKILSIIQITRFLVEMIARWIETLPISPLEYITSAHVFCALITYFFWFDKPRAVLEKIHLKTGPVDNSGYNVDNEVDPRPSDSFKELCKKTNVKGMGLVFVMVSRAEKHSRFSDIDHFRRNGVHCVCARRLCTVFLERTVLDQWRK